VPSKSKALPPVPPKATSHPKSGSKVRVSKAAKARNAPKGSPSAVSEAPEALDAPPAATEITADDHVDAQVPMDFSDAEAPAATEITADDHVAPQVPMDVSDAEAPKVRTN